MIVCVYLENNARGLGSSHVSHVTQNKERQPSCKIAIYCCTTILPRIVSDRFTLVVNFLSYNLCDLS